MKEFKNIIEEVKKHLFLEGESEYIIDLYLAVALSIHLERPVWLMIVAPPSSGKTELLNLIKGIEHYHPLGNITPKTLFSNHPLASGGYMFREVKEKGLLVFSDFTTILSQNSKNRNEIFNQLRIIFDGEASVASGIDTQKGRLWKGKVGVLATVTEAMERIKETQNDLGERFLYYNHFVPELKYSQMNKEDDSEKFVDGLMTEIKNYLNICKTELNTERLSAKVDEQLFNIASFIAIGRATVERDGYRRTISNIHKPERPYRILGLLKSLYTCLNTINENEKRSIRIIQRIAQSSIPKFRLNSIWLTYFSNDVMIPMEVYINHLQISETKTRRVIEDLEKQNILLASYDRNREKYYYEMKSDFKILADSVLRTV